MIDSVLTVDYAGASVYWQTLVRTLPHQSDDTVMWGIKRDPGHFRRIAF